MAKQKYEEITVGKKDAVYMDSNGYQKLLKTDNLTEGLFLEYRSGYFTLNRLLVSIAEMGLKYKVKSPVRYLGKSKYLDSNIVKVDVIKYELFFIPTILARFHLRR